MNATQQFIIALLHELFGAGAFIGILFSIWKQYRLKAVVNDTNVRLQDTQTTLLNVHQQINGKMDQLVAASHQQGMSDQREKTAAEKIVIGQNELH